MLHVAHRAREAFFLSALLSQSSWIIAAAFSLPVGFFQECCELSYSAQPGLLLFLKDLTAHRNSIV